MRLNELPKDFKGRIAVIDADSIIPIVAWNFKEPSEYLQRAEAVDSIIQQIIQDTSATHIIGVLNSDSEEISLRHQIAKTAPYKGNRGEKPIWYLQNKPEMETYLIQEYNMIRADAKYEADDMVCSIANTLNICEIDNVICGVDKDLKQVAGKFYDYKNPLKGVIEVSELDAIKNLYKQLITGDSADNIKGIKGKGTVYASSLIDNCTTSKEVIENTLKAYISAYGDSAIEKLSEMYFLLAVVKNIPVGELSVKKCDNLHEIMQNNHIQEFFKLE